MQLIVFALQGSCQPFRNCTRYTGRDEGLDEIRFGCKGVPDFSNPTLTSCWVQR